MTPSWKSVAVDNIDANQLTPGKIAVFRANVELSADDLRDGQWDLSFGRIDDAGWIFVNGKSVGLTTDWSQPYSFNVTKQLHPGKNSVAVIVRNDGGGGGIGLPTFGRELEGSPVELESFGNPDGVAAQWWQPDFNDQNWEAITIDFGFNADK